MQVENALPAIIHEKIVAVSDIHTLRNQPKVLAYATPALSIKVKCQQSKVYYQSKLNSR